MPVDDQRPQYHAHLSLAPPPANPSATTLFVGAIIAYSVAAGSAALGVSYLACDVPALSVS